MKIAAKVPIFAYLRESNEYTSETGHARVIEFVESIFISLSLVLCCYELGMIDSKDRFVCPIE